MKKAEGEEEKEAPPVWKSDGMPEKLKRLFAFFDHVNNYFSHRTGMQVVSSQLIFVIQVCTDGGRTTVAAECERIGLSEGGRKTRFFDIFIVSTR